MSFVVRGESHRWTPGVSKVRSGQGDCIGTYLRRWQLRTKRAEVIGPFVEVWVVQRTGNYRNLLIPIAMVIGIASVRNLSQGGGLPTGTMAFLSVLGVIIVAVYAVGIWLVTSLEPDRINRPTTASLARWLIIPGMLLSILSEVFTNSGDSTAETIGGFIDLISSIM